MVGDILRREREKQRLTIADIEKGTSIRGVYIEQIERGNINELPGLVYAKGFVRNYANFLHMNPEPLVQQFAEENGGSAVPTAPPAEPDGASRRISLSNVGDESLSKISIGSKTSSYAGIFGKLAVGIIALVAFVAAGAALISAINAPAQETAAPGHTEQPSAPAAAAASDPARTPAVDGVNVSVTLTERCWTEVSVDGQSVFEGIIEKGKTESWQGKESVVVRAGNAGALDVTLNGKKLGVFGDQGEVLERRFTKTTQELKDTLPAARTQEAEAERTQENTAAKPAASSVRSEQTHPTADPRDAKPARSAANRQ